MGGWGEATGRPVRHPPQPCAQAAALQETSQVSVQLQPLLSAPASDFLFPLIWENGDWLRVSRDFSGYLKNASHYFPEIVS